VTFSEQLRDYKSSRVSVSGYNFTQHPLDVYINTQLIKSLRFLFDLVIIYQFTTKFLNILIFVLRAMALLKLTNIPGFFAQDLDETDPASFDYVLPLRYNLQVPMLTYTLFPPDHEQFWAFRVIVGEV
jgi:hypothetical protein